MDTLWYLLLNTVSLLKSEFIKELKLLSIENDFLLIFDEVQTGVCITGKMWAHQYFNVRPDIISFGKKSQVCGILCGDRIHEVENNVFVESSRINSTLATILSYKTSFNKQN